MLDFFDHRAPETSPAAKSTQNAVDNGEARTKVDKGRLPCDVKYSQAFASEAASSDRSCLLFFISSQQSGSDIL